MTFERKLVFGGYRSWFPFWNECAYTNTSCANPGINGKVLTYLGKLLNASVLFLPPRNSTGLQTEKAILELMLENHEIDALGPNQPWTVRYLNKFYSSPSVVRLQLGILMRDPNLTVKVQYGIVGFFSDALLNWVLSLLGCFLMLRWFLAWNNQKKTSHGNSTLKWSLVLFSILVNILLNYYTSSLSIALFKKPMAALPFSSYTEFSEMVLNGQLRLATDKESTTREMELFTKSRNSEQIKIGSLPDLHVDTHRDTESLLENNYLVLGSMREARERKHFLCDAIAVSFDDFPYTYGSFVFSNQTHWLRNALDIGMIETLKVFYNNELSKLDRQYRYNGKRCTVTRSTGLKLGQFAGLVKPLSFILVVALFWLMFEMMENAMRFWFSCFNFL